MVFCCGAIETLSPEEEYNNTFGGTKNGNNNNKSPYVPSNGNALIAGTPLTPIGHEGEHFVTVMVPDGVNAGQTIAVLAPDGSRLVKATIPDGLKSGDTFLVRLAVPIRPPNTVSETIPQIKTIPSMMSQTYFGKSLDQWTTPIDQNPPGAPLQPVMIAEKPKRDPTQPSFVDALDRWLTPVPDEPKDMEPSSPTTTINNNINNDNNSITEDAPVVEPPTTSPTNIEENNEREGPPPIMTAFHQAGKVILIQDELSSPTTTKEINPTPTPAPAQDPDPAPAPAPDPAPDPAPTPVNNQTTEYPVDESEINSKVMQVSGLPVNAEIEPAKPRSQYETESLADTHTDTTVTTISNQKLLLVHIPPGLPAGTTMQVEIPGEDRTLSAIVPHDGMESFHIAYTPRFANRQTPSISSSLDRSGSVVTRPSSIPYHPYNNNHNQESIQQQPTLTTAAESLRGNKLLLVRVPPGTLPGTTLHVSVPDEPGRLLAAKVPPGNVEEFHVSYEARAYKNKQQRNLPPMYNNNPQEHELQYYQQQKQQQHTGYYNNNYQQQQNESWFPGMADATTNAAAAGGSGEYYEMSTF